MGEIINKRKKTKLYSSLLPQIQLIPFWKRAYLIADCTKYNENDGQIIEL